MINKTLLIYLIVGGAALGVGGTAGVVVKRVTGSEQVIYKGFDINNYIMDSDNLLIEFENYQPQMLQYHHQEAEFLFLN